MEQNPRVGDLVDRYFVLHREISASFHSMVFEACHGYTGRPCVIKLLAPRGRSRPGVAERLLREARMLNDARGAAVPEIIGAGICPTHGPYIAMELLKGRSLEGLLASRGRLGASEAVQLAYALCGVLADVHDAGIVHRDIKPGNVWLAPALRGDRVLLIDFDIASRFDDVNATPRLTRRGEVLGTPEYMALEQLLGNVDDVCPASDVYGVAATLFECLTGEAPYPSGMLQALHAHANGPGVPKPRDLDPKLPAALSSAVSAGLARAIKDRPQSARAFASSLSQATGLLPAPLRLLSNEERAEGPQRRKHARAPYVTPVRLRVRGEAIDGHSEDVSEGGMLFVAPGRLPEAPEFTARFALPSSGAIVDVPVQARWTRERRGHFAVGLEFLELSAKQAGEIALYTMMLMSNETTRRVAHSPAA